MKLSRGYRKWDSMIARCYRPSHPAYRYYGERGITVCDAWRNRPKQFLADMGEPPEGLWLDRIDNGKGYEPGNCRWVTPAKSAMNRRRSGPTIDPKSLRQRAIRAGLPYMLVALRVRRGWTDEKALTIPTLPRGGVTLHDRERLGI